MNRNYLLFFFCITLLPFSFAQKSVTTLSFTGMLNNQHIDLDSIWVQNYSQQCDTLLIWPDTVLSFSTVGTQDISAGSDGYNLVQYNSTDSKSDIYIRLLIPVPTEARFTINDILGRQVSCSIMALGSGSHTFQFFPGKERIYLLKASCNGWSKSIKIVNRRPGLSVNCSLVFQGSESNSAVNKATLQTNGFSFQPGDSLKISGYTGSLHTYFFSSPLVNTDYIIPFGMNFPCPSEISFSYGGQTYNTVQIGNQCWMKENLNIGTMVQSIYTGPNPHSNCSDNGIIEKYCYNNDDLNCNLYGGWYDWSEMMGYSTLSGTQGICPSGWHIPMDVEWQVLNDYLGGDVVAGGKMKESGFSSWLPPNTGASNISGFTALGSGYRLHYGNFSGWNQYTSFWSSTEYSAYQAWFMYLVNDTAALTWTKYNNTYGFPVRCLKNE